MKRKRAFGTRPKKTGAKKKYRSNEHKKKLMAAGYEAAFLKRLNVGEVRELLKRLARGKKPIVKPAAKKTSAKIK